MGAAIPARRAPPEGFAPAVRGAPFEVRGALAEQISGDLRIWTGGLADDDYELTLARANLIPSLQGLSIQSRSSSHVYRTSFGQR